MSICFIRLGHHDQPIFRYLFGQFSQMVAKYSDVYKIRKFKDQPRIVLKCFITHNKYLNTHSISVHWNIYTIYVHVPPNSSSILQWFF